MFTLFLLPILVSGYIFLLNHPKYVWKIHRYEGQLILLKSASFGLVVCSFSYFIVFIIEQYEPIESLLKFLRFNVKVLNADDSKIFLDLILLTFVSMFLSFFISKIFYIATFLNFCLFKRVISLKEKFKIKKMQLLILKEIFQEDCSADLLLISGFLEERPLIFHLKNRKFYIGYITKYNIDAEAKYHENDVWFTPIISGYRNKDNLKVEVTNKYVEINSKIEIVIKKEQLESISFFDDNIFNHFQSKEPKKSFLKKLLSK